MLHPVCRLHVLSMMQVTIQFADPASTAHPLYSQDQ